MVKPILREQGPILILLPDEELPTQGPECFMCGQHSAQWHVQAGTVGVLLSRGLEVFVHALGKV